MAHGIEQKTCEWHMWVLSILIDLGKKLFFGLLAFYTFIPPSRGHQAEQVVSRMEVVTDHLCSGVTSRADNVIQEGQRVADYLFS